MFEISTENGEIRFSVNVIKRIVSEAVRANDGKAYIFNFKGRYKSAASGLAYKMNFYHGDFGEPGSIVIEESEDGLRIGLYLVMAFGTSITALCRNTADRIYSGIADVLDRPPAEIRIFITGVESNEIAKRNIVYVKCGDAEGEIDES